VASPHPRHIELRRGLVQPNDHLFLGVTGEVLDYSAVQYTFRCVVRSANIAPERPRPPRIHDLRHSFATRVLQQCGTDRRAVARQTVALATYLGHSDIAHTYWYLQATPELMTDIADAAERLIAGGGA